MKTVVAFALYLFLFSHDNEAVQKLNGGHFKWIVSAMRSCYNIIPEKNDLCCFGCVT